MCYPWIGHLICVYQTLKKPHGLDEKLYLPKLSENSSDIINSLNLGNSPKGKGVNQTN